MSHNPKRPDDRVDVKISATRHYRDQLDAAAGGKDNRTDFIDAALRDAADRAGVTLPARISPNGLRAGVLPDGWKSRLYKDRMQIVAVWNGFEIEFTHLHLYAGGFRDGVLMSEQHPLSEAAKLPNFEMHLSDTLPEDKPNETIAQALQIVILEDGVIEYLEEQI
ncbi:MAG: hypothetical protein ACPG7F_00235 [Aggregatilineales bacterium]